VSSLADVTVYQGADVASDHHTLVTSMNVTLRGGATVLNVGGGSILRAERAKNFFLPPPPPPLFGQLGGGQNIA